MFRKLFFMVSVMAVLCIGLCANAYATPILDLEGGTIKFVITPGNPLVSISPTPIPNQNNNPESVWYPLGLTENNTSYYGADTGGNLILDYYTFPDISNDQNELLEITFSFYDIRDLFTGLYLPEGDGLMETITFGNFSFDYTTNFIPTNPDMPCGGGTLEITATDFNPVPEPATLLLFGVGILGFTGVTRKKTFSLKV